MTNNSKTSNTADKKEAAQLSSKDMPPLNCCKRLWDYQDTPEAKGYALLSMGRGVAGSDGQSCLLAALGKSREALHAVFSFAYNNP